MISLTEAKERQAYITEMMGRYGLDFEFFEAVDGRAYDVPAHENYDAALRRLFFGRDMTGGELGVLLSHKKIYEKIVREEIPLALILEDDAKLFKDFPTVLAALEKGPQDFELARFLGSPKVAALQQYTTRPIVGEYKLNRLCTSPGGAHAYLITFAGAVKMLRRMNRNYLPIDTLLGHCWETGINAFIVQPGLARQDADQPQYIGQARFDKKIKVSGPLKLAYPLGRAWFKGTESLMKRIYYYKTYWNDKRKAG